MPKKSKSKKFKKPQTTGVRELILKSEGQEYAQVTKILGGCRVEAKCFDGKTRIAHIRGAMTKKAKIWILADDVILVGLRDFQDDKADVIAKYDLDEVRKLKKLGEIPDIELRETTNTEEEPVEEAFDFDTL